MSQENGNAKGKLEGGIADAVVFLSSRDSSFVLGHELVVEAG